MTDTQEPGLEPENAAAASEATASAMTDDQPPQSSQEEAKAAPTGQKSEKTEQGPKWFRTALEEKERRAREAERRAQELERRVQPQEPRRPAPDFARDPNGAVQSIQQMMQEQALQQSIALSARFARREHGAETFEEAHAWLSTRPDIERWAMGQDDPWEAAISQYKRERLAEEIGDDPAAWRKAQEEQIRQQVMAEMQAEMGQGYTPAAPSMRVPAPAASARSAAPKPGSVKSGTRFKHDW